MRKCVLAWFLFAAVLLAVGGSAALAADHAEASVSCITAQPGEELELSVTIVGNPGLAAWLFELSWDTEALQFEADGAKAVTIGEGFASGTMLFKKTDTGVRVTWFATLDHEQDGVLFTLHLRSSETASGEYPITLVCSADNTINVAEISVPVRTNNGSVFIGRNGTVGGDTASPSPTPAQTPVSQPDQIPAPQQLAFTDVAPDSYYCDAVRWALENGITSGTTSATFSPGDYCTRGQTVTFLWRAAGSPEPTGRINPFTDVSTGAYYYKAVLWAVEKGITNGVTATSFSPGSIVTRGQAVTFLWRAADGAVVEEQAPFTDVLSGQYYTDAVAWAVARGITNGTTATTFSPSQNCTRGQIITFLYRYYK